jgi:hypothetical protein
MATPETVSQPESQRPDLQLIPGGLFESTDEWTLIARQIEIEALVAEDEDGQTHVIRHNGEAIGATGVFTRSVSLGEDSAVHATEIEVFATNEAYYHTAYLALVTSLIDSDPGLTVINGVEGPEMTAVASDLVHHLPLGWSGEFSLIERGIEVTTFDPNILAAHLANGGKVSHSFKKTGSL